MQLQPHEKAPLTGVGVLNLLCSLALIIMFPVIKPRFAFITAFGSIDDEPVFPAADDDLLLSALEYPYIDAHLAKSVVVDKHVIQIDHFPDNRFVRITHNKSPKY